MTAEKAMDGTRIQNTSIVETALGIPPQTAQDTRKQVIQHNSLFDAEFLTEKNIYFLVVVSIALIITGTITFVRRRQQKLQQQRKEQEYLRYFHSVLPHSQIYGNLNETFSKPNRKNSSKRASIKNHGLNLNEQRRMSVSSVSSLVPGNILKRFKYQHPSGRELTHEADDDDDYNSIEDLDEEVDVDIGNGLDIKTNIGKQSVCKAEATVHSAFNKKVHFTETDVEDIHLNDRNTAENICQKFYFPIDKRTGVIKDTAAKTRKHEPSSPRVRFSMESDEVMHDGIDIDKHIIDDIVTAADHEGDKSNIAEGIIHDHEKNSLKAQNGKVNHLKNGFVNLMQKLSERNTTQSNTNMQEINDCDNNDVSPETNNTASNQNRECISETPMQSSDFSTTGLLPDSVRKSVNFLHMQRCKRDKDMFCKKCKFLFADDKNHFDTCNTKDVQITVL